MISLYPPTRARGSKIYAHNWIAKGAALSCLLRGEGAGDLLVLGGALPADARARGPPGRDLVAVRQRSILSRSKSRKSRRRRAYAAVALPDGIGCGGDERSRPTFNREHLCTIPFGIRIEATLVSIMARMTRRTHFMIAGSFALSF